MAGSGQTENAVAMASTAGVGVTIVMAEDAPPLGKRVVTFNRGKGGQLTGAEIDG